MEAICVGVHLVRFPDDFDKFRNGEVDSTRALKAAKDAIPDIGRLYGLMSEEFVHVGKPFWHFQNGSDYKEGKRQMWQCLAAVSGFP